MKTTFAEAALIFNEPDEVIIAKLLAAYQAIKDINREMKDDSKIQELQDEINTLKEPYKLRIMRQRNIIEAAEVVAKARNLIATEDKLD